MILGIYFVGDSKYDEDSYRDEKEGLKMKGVDDDRGCLGGFMCGVGLVIGWLFLLWWLLLLFLWLLYILLILL